MKDYIIRIQKVDNSKIAVIVNNLETTLSVMTFENSADLDHFIYELKQASFDFQIGQHYKQKEIEPIDGTEL